MKITDELAQTLVDHFADVAEGRSDELACYNDLDAGYIAGRKSAASAIRAELTDIGLSFPFWTTDLPAALAVEQDKSTAEPVSETVKYVAILKRHDRRGKKAVIVPDGQSLEFDEDSATRRWLHPYLGNEYHLCEFLPVEPSALSHVQAPAPVAAPVQVKAHAMTDHDNLIDRLEESAAIYQQHTLKALLSEAAAALHEASLAIDDADKSRRISDRERDEAVNALRAISGDTSK